MPQAVVVHRGSGEKTLTDENGTFRLQVPESRRIVLDIIHPDYIERAVSLTEKEWGQILRISLVPVVRRQEEVVVTALRYPESTSSVPAAEAVVTREVLEEKMVPNIAEGLLDLPGVTNLGAGGFSLVPNIRGLARRRVLILVDNARITSDRRTGPSASFIDPVDIEKIEVLRSPSSVFYGSDAIGGVIHILTRSPAIPSRFRGRLALGYGTVNQEKSFGLSVEGSQKNLGYYLSFQGTDAENYRAPGGRILQSYFTQGSLFGKIAYETEKRSLRFSVLAARGYDIGKPNKQSATKPTWYPLENQNFFHFHWHERAVWGGDLIFQSYANPHALETQKEKYKTVKVKESFSKTQSFDYGFHLSYGKRIHPSLRINAGVDYYGRTGARAETRDTSFSPDGGVVGVLSQTPYRGGRREDLGLFVSADYSGLRFMDVVGGVRADFLTLAATPGGASQPDRSRYTAWTGFTAVSVKLTDQLVLFSNLSRAYRAPSLGELFYTGITGRGFIVAHPGLQPETSLNFDAGLKMFHKRFFAGLYGFVYKIDDLIERYRSAEATYTYGNVTSGLIRGVEAEAEVYPVSGWKIFGNVFFFRGRSSAEDEPLNDIPPPRVFLGTKFWVHRFSLEIAGTFQQEKKDPGPAEIAIPGYGILDLKANYFINSTLRVFLRVSNAFNKSFFARPDPDGVEEPGRNLLFGLRYEF